MIKNLHKKCHKFLLHIFNVKLPRGMEKSNYNYVAETRKLSVKCNSYRPLSFPSNLSKIFEKCLLEIINKFELLIKDKGLISEHQYEFRKLHGTTEQVYRIVENIQIGFEKKYYYSAIFIDLTQAFDRVLHKGLVTKLSGFFPEKLSRFVFLLPKRT